MNRRGFVLSSLVMITAGTSRAQSLPVASPSPKPFALFNEHGALTDQLTPEQHAEVQLDSPAPAGSPGRWVTRASLPTPTSEMGGGATWGGRLHVVGGWIVHTEHYIYDASGDRWFRAAPLPRPGNHIPVAADAGRFYALGGFQGPNVDAFADVYAYEIDQDRWMPQAPLPRARGAGGAAILNGRIHLVGGAVSIPGERTSVAWHEAYDPQTDRWARLAPLPGARDHLGVTAYQGRLYVAGGRFNTPAFNSDLHHVYLPDQDRWEAVASMNGKPSPKVYGQMESYDPGTNTWQHHTTMPTPRHGPGAAVIGDMIYTVAGAPVAGGSMQAATNEAFTLS